MRVELFHYFIKIDVIVFGMYLIRELYFSIIKF